MVKARELVAMQQIDFAVKTIQDAVKELGIEGLEAGVITLRIQEKERSFTEGITAEKGAELKKIMEKHNYSIGQKESDFRPVNEVVFRQNGVSIYCDISMNSLDKLKAEQERIAAKIARLEGVSNGTA